MATCPHADRLIPLLHDNELQNPLRREMVTHMSTCVTCARTFSLLEREQELFTQVIEQRVDSIDFSDFWHAVEQQIAEPAPSRFTRFRLWYESWHQIRTLPIPVWAAAALLFLLVPTHLSLNTTNLSPTPPNEERETRLIPPVESPQQMTPLAPSPNVEQAPSVPVFTPDSFESPQFHTVSRAELESITVGPGAMTIELQHDHESNSLFIFYGHGTSEYPQ